jgi:hypothetical protein
MMNKSKQIWVIIVVLAVIFAGFLWYKSYSAKNKIMQLDKTETKGPESSLENTLSDDEVQAISDEEADAISAEEEDFNAICENGEWVKIADQSGSLSTFSGKLRKVYPDDETATEFAGNEFYLEGAEKIALTGENLEKMDYFEDREVEVQGVKSAEKKEMAVSQVKCGGKETDKNLINDRKKMMDYIAANINSIAPKKAKYKSWVVDEIDIVNENNVYVMYYDAIEDDENSDVEEDTGRKILLEVSAKTDGTYGAKQIAYFEMGEDDYALSQGTDKFSDSETIDYSYDPDNKTWERY